MCNNIKSWCGAGGVEAALKDHVLEPLGIITAPHAYKTGALIAVAGDKRRSFEL